MDDDLRKRLEVRLLNCMLQEAGRSLQPCSAHSRTKPSCVGGYEVTDDFTVGVLMTVKSNAVKLCMYYALVASQTRSEAALLLLKDASLNATASLRALTSSMDAIHQRVQAQLSYFDQAEERQRQIEAMQLSVHESVQAVAVFVQDTHRAANALLGAKSTWRDVAAYLVAVAVIIFASSGFQRVGLLCLVVLSVALDRCVAPLLGPYIHIRYAPGGTLSDHTAMVTLRLPGFIVRRVPWILRPLANYSAAVPLQILTRGGVVVFALFLLVTQGRRGVDMRPRAPSKPPYDSDWLNQPGMTVEQAYYYTHGGPAPPPTADLELQLPHAITPAQPVALQHDRPGQSPPTVQSARRRPAPPLALDPAALVLVQPPGPSAGPSSDHTPRLALQSPPSGYCYALVRTPTQGHDPSHRLPADSARVPALLLPSPVHHNHEEVADDREPSFAPTARPPVSSPTQPSPQPKRGGKQAPLHETRDAGVTKTKKTGAGAGAVKKKESLLKGASEQSTAGSTEDTTGAGTTGNETGTGQRRSKRKRPGAQPALEVVREESEGGESGEQEESDARAVKKRR